MHILTNIRLTLFTKKLFWLTLPILSFIFASNSLYMMIYAPQSNPLLGLNLFQSIDLAFSFIFTFIFCFYF